MDGFAIARRVPSAPKRAGRASKSLFQKGLRENQKDLKGRAARDVSTLTAKGALHPVALSAAVRATPRHIGNMHFRGLGRQCLRRCSISEACPLRRPGLGSRRKAITMMLNKIHHSSSRAPVHYVFLALIYFGRDLRLIRGAAVTGDDHKATGTARIFRCRTKSPQRWMTKYWRRHGFLEPAC